MHAVLQIFMDHIMWIYTLNFLKGFTVCYCLKVSTLFNEPPILWAFTVVTYQFLTVLKNDAIIFITIMQMFPKEILMMQCLS